MIGFVYQVSCARAGTSILKKLMGDSIVTKWLFISLHIELIDKIM
jgi:hypothetical protein